LIDHDTPFTPAISLVRGLREILNRIQKEGMEKIWKRTEGMAQKTRDAMSKRGLELFAKYPANTLTAVKVPAGIDGSKLVSIMRDEKGVTFAGGQGSMKGKILRMAHFGFVTAEDVDTGLSVLSETLEELQKSKV